MILPQRAALIILIALVIAAPVATAKPASDAHIDAEEDCLEAVPEEVSVADVTDDGHESILEVHTLLDGVPLEEGRAAMAAAARPFTEIKVKLVATFEEVTIPATGQSVDAPTLDTQAAFNFARNHTGGFRTHGSDVVYVMTTKDLVGALGGGVAGQADCIGGVRYPNRAFAVGEMESDPYGDYWFGSIVAGHEIGHLLGAHHHYANCAQGNPDDIVEFLTPCTLMFNTVTFVSRRFSSAEAAAVRGHMLAFADDTPTGPPAISPRNLTLKLKRGNATGRLTSELIDCYELIDVVIERKKGEAWTALAHATTTEVGTYGVKFSPRNGSYRALVSESKTHDGNQWRTCEQALSPAVSVKDK